MRNKRAVFGWLALWLLLFALSHNHAPTIGLMVVQTSIMIGMSMCAFYTGRLILSGSLPPSPLRSVAVWAVLIVAAGFLSAFVIGKIYDVFVGNDIRRVALTVNTVLDVMVVAFNIFVMTLILRGKERLSRPRS